MLFISGLAEVGVVCARVCNVCCTLVRYVGIVFVYDICVLVGDGGRSSCICVVVGWGVQLGWGKMFGIVPVRRHVRMKCRKLSSILWGWCVH